MMQRTLVLIKPDAVQRGLIGEVTTRFERKGLKLAAMKMMQLTENMLKDHYSHIADKPFFPGIAEFMQSSPVVAQCWEGKDAVAVVRGMCGITNSREAHPGTLRGDYAMSIQCNIVHASEDTMAAEQELERFFNTTDFCDYSRAGFDIMYSNDEREEA